MFTISPTDIKELLSRLTIGYEYRWTFSGKELSDLGLRRLCSIALDKCESHIEFLLFLAMGIQYVDWFGDDPIENIYPQRQIGIFRNDFFVKHDDACLVVECDGHEFHEKTKEQSSRDKHRDRLLQSVGQSVFRFTGSEIWNNPLSCAHEIMVFLQ